VRQLQTQAGSRDFTGLGDSFAGEAYQCAEASERRAGRSHASLTRSPNVKHQRQPAADDRGYLESADWLTGNPACAQPHGAGVH